ncbi:MAG TPA: hypothetical protein VMS55_05735 [Myxococcota bacterium]|nr:hypothetical protein [Myxococcota bacterium]
MLRAMTATRLLVGLLGAAIAMVDLGCDTSSRSAGGNDVVASPEGQGGKAAAGQASALQAALAEPDGFVRARKLAELLPSLGPEAATEVERALEKRRGNPAGAEFEMLVRFWAQQDPQAATVWAYGLTAPGQRLVGVQTAIEQWAKVDPQSAAATVVKASKSQNIDQTTSQSAFRSVVRGWLLADRPGVEQHIRELGQSPERELWIHDYALALLQTQGPDALTQWARALPTEDESLKRSAYYHVASVLAGFDPAVGRRWCDDECEGPFSVGMRSVIVATMLRDGRDRATLVDWVARAPETPENDQVLVVAYQKWAGDDRDSALAWMRQKQAEAPDPRLRKLYSAYARNLATTSPAEAIQWAERIENESEREEVLIEVAGRWRSQDQAAADAWLAGSPLSKTARERVRTPAPVGQAEPPSP